MKRAHYLAGAVGLATAALGAAPTAATAASIQPGTGSAKTVSLHPILGTGAAASKAAVSSGASSAPASSNPPTIPASSPATTAGCKGNTVFKFPRHGDVRGHGWYGNNWDDSYTCLGTIVVSTYFVHSNCKDVHLSWSWPSWPGGATRGHSGPIYGRVCGAKGKWEGYSFGLHDDVHHLSHYGVSLYAGSTYGAHTKTTQGG